MSGKAATPYLSTHGVPQKVPGRGRHGLPSAVVPPKTPQKKRSAPGSVRSAGSGIENR